VASARSRLASQYRQVLWRLKKMVRCARIQTVQRPTFVAGH
jgi:hypothetical protein